MTPEEQQILQQTVAFIDSQIKDSDETAADIVLAGGDGAYFVGKSKGLAFAAHLIKNIIAASQPKRTA